MEDCGSEYAEQGTCAHALCERKLRELIFQHEIPSPEFDALKDKWYDSEMENCASDYASVVWNKFQDALKVSPDAHLLIERRLDFSAYIPNSFGTADAIIICDNTMEVIDFKYGKGVEVSAEMNPQMMIYALGAISEFELDFDILSVRMTIIQPRISNYSEWVYNVDDLKLWGNTEVKEAAIKAFAGEGEQEVGDWCKFCKIKATCSALANKAISIYTKHEEYKQIGLEDLPNILGLIPAIKNWCSSVEDHATGLAMNGESIPGYKLVEGRSIRKVTDTATLAGRLLDDGMLTEEDIYKPRELKPIGDLEKIAGKKAFAEMSHDCIVKPNGKPTLVPESDKRKAINVADNAAKDFENIITD